MQPTPNFCSVYATAMIVSMAESHILAAMSTQQCISTFYSALKIKKKTGPTPSAKLGHV